MRLLKRIIICCLSLILLLSSSTTIILAEGEQNTPEEQNTINEVERLYEVVELREINSKTYRLTDDTYEYISLIYFPSTTSENCTELIPAWECTYANGTLIFDACSGKLIGQ